MPQKYRSYHSDIKLAAGLDMLPASLLPLIPRSSVHRFKNTDYSSLFGLETDMTALKAFAHDKAALKLYRAALWIKNTIISLHAGTRSGKLNRAGYMAKAVAAVMRAKGAIGFKRALRYFHLTKARFYSWFHQIKLPCRDSVLRKCFRLRPNQLTSKEVVKLKRLHDAPRFRFWPTASIAYYALRHNLLLLSMGTWYKYTKLLGLYKSLHKNRRKKRKTGIRAVKPNAIWHADVMVIRTLDNVKAYIYLLIDNFSRFILDCSVSLNLSGHLRMETIREAYLKQQEEIVDPTTLLVDGGSENNCEAMDEFLDSGVPLKKLIAQKDIVFSNSMVESANKLVKYRYLFHKDFPDIHSLENHLEECVHDYNFKRPHCSLHGLTPHEAFSGITLDRNELKQRIRMAMKVRIVENRKARCGIC